MSTLLGIAVGFLVWFIARYLIGGFYTVNQNERAVKTSFGRAQRLGNLTSLDDPTLASTMRPEEQSRYNWPQVKVIGPGGPYLKMPWEKVYKVSVSTATINMAVDLENAQANYQGAMLEAVTKDQLNTGLTGQIRYRVSENNLYAYIFGIKKPIVHIMGYFVSVLRQRIASFEAKPIPITMAADDESALSPLDSGNIQASTSSPHAVRVVSGVSINDLRKNLRDLNDYMDQECRSAPARYGVVLDASLITGIDPPAEVESALAAINTAHNLVSSDISLAQAAADQKIVLSKRAVEIETLKAQAEVEPLKSLAHQLMQMLASGPDSLTSYLRNVQLELYTKAQRIFIETR